MRFNSEPDALGDALPDAQATPARGPVVLACLDASSYAPSVCDHAAWLAGCLDGEVDLLHVAEDGAASPADAPSPLLARAGDRLSEQGIAPHRRRTARGPVGEAVIALANRQAACTVIGRRGVGAQRSRRRLGQHVAAILAATRVPVCVAPKLFLPISRALVLFAPWSGQERWAHALAASPLLDGLDVSLGRLDSAEDVVVLEPDWTELPPAQAPTFERARCPARLRDVLQASAFDLVVLPRALAFDHAAPRAAAHAILRSRLPVLIC